MKKLLLIPLILISSCYFRPINIDPGREPLKFIPESLPAGALGRFYSVSLHAEGGYPPYEFKIIGGEFPPGLECGSNGIISGFPIDEGAFDFIAMVTDYGEYYGGENSHGQIFTIVISGSIPLTILTTKLPDGQVGILYDACIEFVGGTAPYSMYPANPPLPPGLFIWYPGNIIHGTPQVAGDYIIVMILEDNKTARDIMTYTLTIHP